MSATIEDKNVYLTVDKLVKAAKQAATNSGAKVEILYKPFSFSFDDTETTLARTKTGVLLVVSGPNIEDEILSSTEVEDALQTEANAIVDTMLKDISSAIRGFTK